MIGRISAGTVAFSRIHHHNCMVLHAQLDSVLVSGVARVGQLPGHMV